MIDEAPSQYEGPEALEAFSVKDELDSLIHGSNEEGQMNNKVFGYLLAWNATLLKIEHGRIKATLASEVSGTSSDYLKVLGALTELLETDATTYQMMLVSLVPYLPKVPKKGFAG